MSRLPAFEYQTDAQVLNWVIARIANKEAEDAVCDYKASVNLSTDKGKKELLKDITGFANHLGGVLLIGVPEVKTDDNRTVPSDDYGIAPEAKFDTRLEQVIRDCSAPSLPALDVRELKIDEKGEKVIYFVYHPKSWLRPHMSLVDSRYYKRGSQITQEMEENDVEALYVERQAAKKSVQQYIKGIDFGGDIAPLPMPLKLAVVPMPIRDGLIDFFAQSGRKLAEEHPFFPRGGCMWSPCADGVMTHATSMVNESKYIAKLLPTGTFTYAVTMQDYVSDGKVHLGSVARVALDNGVLSYLQKLYSALGNPHKLHISLSVEGLEGVQLAFPSRQSVFSDMNQRVEYFNDNRLAVAFDVPFADLLRDPMSVRGKLRDRLAQLIGLWHAPAE